MTSYAAQKGRSLHTSQAASAKPLAPVSPTDQARIGANKDFVLAHMPDLLPLIRDLHAEGLIDGWRSVVRVTLLDGKSDE